MKSNPRSESLFSFDNIMGSKSKFISKDSYFLLKNVAMDMYIGLDQHKQVERNLTIIQLNKKRK